MRKLLSVHDSFEVPERGQVIVGRSEDKDAQLLAGQKFVLVLANGERHSLTAFGVEQFTRCFSEATQLASSSVRSSTLQRLSQIQRSGLIANNSFKPNPLRGSA